MDDKNDEEEDEIVEIAIGLQVPVNVSSNTNLYQFGISYNNSISASLISTSVSKIQLFDVGISNSLVSVFCLLGIFRQTFDVIPS